MASSGYIFYPIAWVMGVPSSEALQVGSIMATKLVSNEFVAMMDLQKIASTLSPRAEGIISVFWFPSLTSHQSGLSQVQLKA